MRDFFLISTYLSLWFFFLYRRRNQNNRYKCQKEADKELDKVNGTDNKGMDLEGVEDASKYKFIRITKIVCNFQFSKEYCNKFQAFQV